MVKRIPRRGGMEESLSQQKEYDKYFFNNACVGDHNGANGKRAGAVLEYRKRRGKC